MRKALAVVGVLVACAHAQVSPLQVSEDVLHGAALTFEATSAGMRSVNGLLTEAQRVAWNGFAAKFDAGFKVASDAARAAEAKHDESGVQQAGAALGALLGELTTFEVMLAQVKAANVPDTRVDRTGPSDADGGT